MSKSLAPTSAGGSTAAPVNVSEILLSAVREPCVNSSDAKSHYRSSRSSSSSRNQSSHPKHFVSERDLYDYADSERDNEFFPAHNAEAPPLSLLQYFRVLADLKCAGQISHENSQRSRYHDIESAAVNVGDDMSSSDVVRRNAVIEMFDSTALVALCVLFEEIVAEDIECWSRNADQSALPFSIDGLRVEAELQLQACVLDMSNVELSHVQVGLILKNRLESIFDRNLTEHESAVIRECVSEEVTKRVSAGQQKSDDYIQFLRSHLYNPQQSNERSYA